MTSLRDTLAGLAGLTPARVRLDSIADALPIGRLLAFQEDHAAARDAIFRPADFQALSALPGFCGPVLRSLAPDRASYIRRPDLGRRLAPGSEIAKTDPLLAVVVCDGLSSRAADDHAAGVIEALRQVFPEAHTAPIFAVEQGRVAIGDEVAAACGARLCLMLIGERPGLTVSDSLGAYLTWNPRPGTRDSARNCVSNIHTNGGLSYQAAAARIAWLLREALRIQATGVTLKDNSGALPGQAAGLTTSGA